MREQLEQNLWKKLYLNFEKFQILKIPPVVSILFEMQNM